MTCDRRRAALLIGFLVVSCRESAPPADPVSVIGAMRSAIDHCNTVEYDFDIRISSALRKEMRAVRGHVILQPRDHGFLRIDATREPLEGEQAPRNHYVLTSDGATVTMLSEVKRTIFTAPMHRAGQMLFNGRAMPAARVFLNEGPVSRIASEKRFRIAGTATLDGVVCDVLTGEIPDDHVRADLAVGRDDHLPRRVVVRYPNGEADTRLTQVHSVNSFDSNQLRIAAPADFASHEWTLGGPAVGDAAPPFTLDAGGKSISLASFKGEPVVLDFWATWCGPCRASIPELQKIYSAGDAQVIGATWKETGDPDKFAKELGITYPHGNGETIAGPYGVDDSGIPAIFVIDGRGRVADFFLGWSGQETVQQLQKTLQRLRTDDLARK